MGIHRSQGIMITVYIPYKCCVQSPSVSSPALQTLSPFALNALCALGSLPQLNTLSVITEMLHINMWPFKPIILTCGPLNQLQIIK